MPFIVHMKGLEPRFFLVAQYLTAVCHNDLCIQGNFIGQVKIVSGKFPYKKSHFQMMSD